MAHAADTATLVLQAGDTIEAAHTATDPPDWKDDQWNDCPDGRGSCQPAWPYVSFCSVFKSPRVT
jgi:hypothetical protein